MCAQKMGVVASTGRPMVHISYRLHIGTRAASHQVWQRGFVKKLRRESASSAINPARVEINSLYLHTTSNQQSLYWMSLASLGCGIPRAVSHLWPGVAQPSCCLGPSLSASGLKLRLMPVLALPGAVWSNFFHFVMHCFSADLCSVTVLLICALCPSSAQSF